jgi:YHS domain-containing protein
MTAIDPVCQMEVEESTAEWKSTYQGQTYYFCAPGCQRSFEKDPAKYVKPAAGHDAPQPGQAHGDHP